jgi:hypothetical protein
MVSAQKPEQEVKINGKVQQVHPVKEGRAVKMDDNKKAMKKYPTKRLVAVKPSPDANKKLEPLKVQPAKKVVRNSRELKLVEKEK